MYYTQILVDGYIRSVQRLFKNILIPSAINIICIEFYFYNICQNINSWILKDDKDKLIFLKLLHESKKDIIDIEQEMEMIYNGSIDGFTSTDFHRKCDNMGPTISIIQTEHGNIFGGYSSISWLNKGGGKQDKNAFLFLIKSSKNYPAQIFNLKKIDRYSVFHTNYDSCSWGDGDIVINNNCNVNKASYTQKSHYNLPESSYLNGGIKRFTVRRLEVFAVK